MPKTKIEKERSMRQNRITRGITNLLNYLKPGQYPFAIVYSARGNGGVKVFDGDLEISAYGGLAEVQDVTNPVVWERMYDDDSGVVDTDNFVFSIPEMAFLPKV